VRSSESAPVPASRDAPRVESLSEHDRRHREDFERYVLEDAALLGYIAQARRDPEEQDDG
jgi:hypothetical protein